MTRVIIVETCKSYPLVMVGTRGLYCDKNSSPIADPLTIPDTCELPEK